jgi:glucosamine--fructose-6-phosphate aminotransferase (isomerizing)
MGTRLIEAIHSQADELERLAERDVEPWGRRLVGCRRLWLVGTGSSQHCAELGAQMFQESGIDARWASAAQFVRWLPAPQKDDGVIVISHTAETAFAIAARARAVESGARVVSITGVGSGWPEAFETVARERSETYTVSYTAALMTLGRLAAEVSGAGLTANEVSLLTQRTREVLADGPDIDLPRQLRVLALVGAGPSAITAREGALKVREAARTLAEGFEAEYLLHGSAVPLGEGDALLLLQPSLDPDGLTAALGGTAEAEGLLVTTVDEPPLQRRLDQIPLTIRLQLLAADMADREGSDPDQAITGRWADDRLWDIGRP